MAEISGPTLVSIVRVHPGETLDDSEAASRAKKKTPIVCSPSDTVADLKARYLKNSPRRDQIQLRLKYNGKSLLDTDKIAGIIPNGAWLYYESVAMSPKGPVASIASLRMRAGGIPALNLAANGGSNYESAPKPEFIADTKGVFKAEGAQALVVAPVMPPAVPQAQNDTADSASAPIGRTLAYTHTMMVNHCVFRVIHMHEGRWSGDAVAVNTKGTSVRSLSSDALTFSDTASRWTSVQSITDTSGFTTKTTFVLTPASDGVMRVHLEGSTTSFRMEESGRNILLFTGVDIETGRVTFVETITLLSDMRRVRTSQHFAANGDVRTITYDERRVIGAVDGAIEPVVD